MHQLICNIQSTAIVTNDEAMLSLAADTNTVGHSYVTHAWRTDC